MICCFGLLGASRRKAIKPLAESGNFLLDLTSLTQTLSFCQKLPETVTSAAGRRLYPIKPPLMPSFRKLSVDWLVALQGLLILLSFLPLCLMEKDSAPMLDAPPSAEQAASDTPIAALAAP
jgi:hypothetical protein